MCKSFQQENYKKVLKIGHKSIKPNFNHFREISHLINSKTRSFRHVHFSVYFFRIFLSRWIITRFSPTYYWWLIAVSIHPLDVARLANWLNECFIVDFHFFQESRKIRENKNWKIKSEKMPGWKTKLPFWNTGSKFVR